MNVNAKSLSLSSDDILEAYAPPHQEPGDITLSMAAQRWRVGLSKARRKLDELVERKVLKVVEHVALDNGRAGRVWRPVKKGKA